MPAEPASVFLSYSHDSPEHVARVKCLATQLQASGLTVALDQAVAPEPAEGWTLWCRQHALYSRMVLVVCSALYKQRWEQRDLPNAGLGVGWEAHLLRAKFLHEEHLSNPRMRPVLLPGFSLENIPIELRDWKVYRPLESTDDMKELIDRVRSAPDPAVPFVVAPLATKLMGASRPISQPSRRLPTFVEVTAALLCLVTMAPDGTKAPTTYAGRPPTSPTGGEVIWELIEGGTFVMRPRDTPPTAPAIELSVDSFHVSRHEITVKQYRECVSQSNCAPPDIGDDCNWNAADRDIHPVNCVSWYDASAYAAWASKQTHKPVRLPTEAEFEYLASHYGKMKYPWGNDVPTCGRATLSFDTPCASPGTADVCSHEPLTDTSLCDLIGNVWEWSSDSYDLNEAIGGMAKILRGGSWRQRPDEIDASTRNWRDPFVKQPTIGFRVVYSN